MSKFGKAAAEANTINSDGKAFNGNYGAVGVAFAFIGVFVLAGVVAAFNGIFG